MSEAKQKRALFVILLTIFIDIIGYGILIPIIPLLLTDPSSKFYLLNHQFSLNEGYVILGFLTASFSIFQFISAPIFGQISDKYGRKIVIALSLSGTFISHIVFIIGIISKNIPLLFIARSFDGLTAGSIAASTAAIADITKPENRSKNFGLIGAAFGLGFIIGPFLGGKLSDPNFISWFNATTPFYLAAVLSFVSIMSVVFLFKETLIKKTVKMRITLTQSITNIYRAFQLKNIRTIFLTLFLYQGGFAFFTTFFSVYLISKFSFDQGGIGNVFAFLGIWMVISQVLVVRLVAKIFTEAKIFGFSLLGSSIMIVLFVLLNASWQVYLLVPVFAILNGLSQANSTALVSRQATSEVQGEIMGINSSITSLASGLPPILSGYIAALTMPRGTMVVASLIMIVSFGIFYFGFRPKNKCEWTAECYKK